MFHTLVLIELGLHILQRLNRSKQTGCLLWHVLVLLVILRRLGIFLGLRIGALLVKQTEGQMLLSKALMLLPHSLWRSAIAKPCKLWPNDS